MLMLSRTEVQAGAGMAASQSESRFRIIATSDDVPLVSTRQSDGFNPTKRYAMRTPARTLGRNAAYTPGVTPSVRLKQRFK